MGPLNFLITFPYLPRWISTFAGYHFSRLFFELFDSSDSVVLAARDRAPFLSRPAELSRWVGPLQRQDGLGTPFGDSPRGLSHLVVGPHSLFLRNFSNLFHFFGPLLGAGLHVRATTGSLVAAPVKFTTFITFIQLLGH